MLERGYNIRMILQRIQGWTDFFARMKRRKDEEALVLDF